MQDSGTLQNFKLSWNVTDIEQNPAEVINTGGWVRVDVDKGIIEVTKKG